MIQTRQLRLFSLLFLSALSIVVYLWPTISYAVDYEVTATVPFDPPTQPAVIDPSFNGKTVDSSLTLIYGTCEHLNPASIVSIWREGTLLGSVNCELSGTFQLSVSLRVGSNILIARSSSLSNNYGPDSSPVTINFVEPAVPPNTPSSGQPTNNTPTPQNTGITDLVISTPEPFVIMDAENAAAIQVIIKGGKGPYTVTINWGDGTTESSVVADLGTFSFKHKYVDNGIYKVVATVTDVLGTSEVYQFIISALSLPNEAEKPQETSVPSEKGYGIWYVAGGLICVLLLILLLATTFWLGRRYEHHELKDVIIEQPKKRLLPTRKKKDES